MIASNQPHQNNPPARYNHAHWEGRRRFLRFLIRVIGFNLLVRLDRVEGIENVPAHGPAIMMINHIAFVDPIVVLHLLPRNIVPLAKVEVYNYPLVGVFPRMWGVIPVRREEIDRRAIQGALDVLRAGEIILVAPEATRSPQLQQGKEGVAYLASRSGAPIVPVAIEGSEGFPTLPFKKRWRGPGVQVRFGRPFQYLPTEDRHQRGRMRQMTDEAMYVLAAMLPESRRGVYSDLSKATQDTLAFL
jgi:1-acyl-sn-glycerol-3-phosphate acyltransferase